MIIYVAVKINKISWDLFCVLLNASLFLINDFLGFLLNIQFRTSCKYRYYFELCLICLLNDVILVVENFKHLIRTPHCDIDCLLYKVLNVDVSRRTINNR